jgi:hypothetical protein
MTPIQQIIARYKKESSKINFSNWFNDNKTRLLKEETELVEKSIEPAESDIIDYDPIPINRLKNTIARKEGFANWQDLMYKTSSGNLELIYDKQLAIAFKKITDLHAEIEDHKNDFLEVRDLTNEIDKLI